jgi:phosphoglucomutase
MVSRYFTKGAWRPAAEKNKMEKKMVQHSLAGKPAPRNLLVNIPRLISAYYTCRPDVDNPVQRISFGTSGHRGSSQSGSFNENHILAVTQALCEYRKSSRINGPLFIGKDTHALSEPAFITAMEVFAASATEVIIQQEHGYTPTPVISHAILNYNRSHKTAPADGVVITPSHNPPEDGGFKYNPPTGGPAGAEITKIIENRANEILAKELPKIKRISFLQALQARTTHPYDYIKPYVQDLKNIIDMETIASSGLKIGVDPMGGSGIDYWLPIMEDYRLNLVVVNPIIDPTFSFMTVDKDGKIRMDCSSPFAMAGLINLKNSFDIAFGNDPDYDRHGIVTKTGGLMNPNHYLTVAVWYLCQNRPDWPGTTGIGKTLVSSSMIDRAAKFLKRNLVEVPVGFKWFVDGLADGSIGFGGEESAGATFLRKNGTVWTTDKDGIIMDLLSAEITVKTGQNPAEIYQNLESRFGRPLYERMDVAASKQQKTILQNLSPHTITLRTLAGEKILATLTHAPGNQAAIGGLKVITENGWFAARPSGTEDVYKIYAESFLGEEHLRQIQQEAQLIIADAFKKGS